MGKVKKATGPGTHLSPFISDLLGLSGYLLIENKCGQQNSVWVIAVTPRYICLVCERCASNDVSLHGTFQHDVVQCTPRDKKDPTEDICPAHFLPSLPTYDQSYPPSDCGPSPNFGRSPAVFP
jgi:hypothetical protein